MSTWIKNGFCLVLLSLLSFSQLSFSQGTGTSTVLLNEDFSGATFPPSGWTSNNFGWYQTSEGNGGDNGAAFVDMWTSWYGLSDLTTPVMDLSTYDANGDTAFVEFDFWFEYTDYNQSYGTDYDDNFHVYAVNNAGSKDLLKLSTTADYTIDNTGGAAYSTYPTTNGGDWRHYKIGIPAAYRTSETKILFEAEPGPSGLDGVAIDNILITGIQYTKLAFTPRSGPINFGDVTVADTSGTKCVVFSNAYPTTMTISNIALTGSDAADFFITRMPDPLPPGTSANPSRDSVCIRANPKSAGIRQAQLTFTADDELATSGSIPLTVKGLAPSTAANVTTLFRKSRTTLGSCYEQPIIVTNNSTGGVLKINPIASSIQGDYPDQYSIARLPTTGIAPGVSDTVVVRYCPTIEGSRPAYLNIVSNASNGDLRVYLYGLGVLPRLVISPSPLEFDSVAVGEQVCHDVALTNTGSDTLRISRLEFVSRDGDFTTDQFLDSVILPEQSKSLRVCFTPIQFGSRFATIKVSTNIPPTFDAQPRDTSAFYLDIAGTGVPFGKFGFNGQTSTDSVLVGTEICHQDTITNTGTADLTIQSGKIMGGDSADFTITGITFPTVIPVGGKKIVTICSTPAAAGNRTSVLAIVGVNGGEPFNFNLPLSVYGQTACASASPMSAFKAPVLLTKSETATITVTNCGEVASTYTAALDNPEYTIVGSSTSGSVAPGATTSFDVKFAPTAMGARPGKLTLTSTAVSPIVIDLNGVGGAVILSGTGRAPQTAVGATSAEFAVTIQNDGNVDFTPDIPSVSGPFNYISGGNTPIAAGSTGMLMFTFTPTKTGANVGQATFPMGSPSTTFQLNLSGEGVSSSVRDVVPAGYALGQNYPNPFTPNTVISFAIPSEANVTIVFTDVKSNIVQRVTGRYGAGAHEVKIEGSSLSSGTYFYTLYSGDAVITKQMTRVK